VPSNNIAFRSAGLHQDREIGVTAVLNLSRRITVRQLSRIVEHGAGRASNYEFGSLGRGHRVMQRRISRKPNESCYFILTHRLMI
jgi:hypothetical protein